MLLGPFFTKHDTFNYEIESESDDDDIDSGSEDFDDPVSLSAKVPNNKGNNSQGQKRE